MQKTTHVGTDSLARLLSPKIDDLSALFQAAKESASREEDSLYFDHELKALEDIRRGCDAVLRGEVGIPDTIEPLPLKEGWKLNRTDGQWSIEGPNGTTSFEGFDETAGSALAEDLYNRVGPKNPAFAGHDSLADQISTHISAWHNRLSATAKQAKNPDDLEPLMELHESLGQVSVSCNLANARDKAPRVRILHDENLTHPFRIEIERDVDGSEVCDRMSQDSKGQWHHGGYIGNKLIPGGPVNEAMCVLSDQVIARRKPVIENDSELSL